MLTSDAMLMPLSAAVVAAASLSILGFLLAKYRDIFFAMLSLAFSMILYGLLVKRSVLGSTRRLQPCVQTAAGIALGRAAHRLRSLCASAAVIVFVAALALHRYLRLASAADSRRRSATTSCASSTWALRCGASCM